MVKNNALDHTDIKILGILQADSGKSVQEIAEMVGLTVNPCWRRIKRMEETGVIEGRVAVVNAMALGLGMTAFVMLRTDQHTSDWLEKLSNGVARIPEIVECHRMTGEVDYLLKIVVSDLAHYDRVYRRLLDFVPGLNDVSAAFSMERLKKGGIIDASTAA